ncbi:hypothetical protein KIL84_012143 [Mauremys mutica]|uniref:Uncharacterized protein n=1 Tax=Mauremys mutica TaxID=74926 RepID=A0A9D4B2Y3_9SAUR|nr:hypothetical protein KIL84_012143 [Mauremys mutica]
MILPQDGHGQGGLWGDQEFAASLDKCTVGKGRLGLCGPAGCIGSDCRRLANEESHGQGEEMALGQGAHSLEGSRHADATGVQDSMPQGQETPNHLHNGP